MKKFSKSIFSIALVLMLCMALVPSAFAANSPINGPAAVSFNSYLVMDKGATVPTVAFTYGVTAGEAVAAAAGKTEVIAGPNPTAVKVSNSEFTPTMTNDATGLHTTLQSGDDPLNFTPGDQQYAKTTSTINMNGVSFGAPGIYRYVLTEKPVANDVPANVAGISHETANTRVLDVYVGYASDTDAAAGTLSILGQVLHNSKDDVANLNGTDLVFNPKKTGFTNYYDSSDLTLKKLVTGNQGDRDKYFKFDITIGGTGVAGNFKLTDGSGNALPTGDITGFPTGTKNATVITAGTMASVYLKANDTIKIWGLPTAATYTIAEDKATCLDYTTTIQLDADGAGLADVASINAVAVVTGVDPEAEFTNNRQGTVPTGIMMDIAPYAIMVLLAGAAFIFLFSKKRSAKT